jgi:hypothetical protein
MKNHYVYQITYNTGKKYIGVRSCKCNIEADPYMGSAFHLPSEAIIGCKEILSIHTTRESAMLEEIRLHALYDVKNNPEFYNQCNATSVKFQISKEAILRGSETRRGRTKETHEYILKQVESRAKYKGDGLTLAQKAQWKPERMEERMRKYKATLAKTMEDPERAAKIQDARIRGGLSCTGIPNPKKGHTGLDNVRAKAWWYKKPNGDIVYVNNSIRGCTDTFPVSKATIMRYIRDNKVPQRILDLGWDFGLINEQEITNPAE